MSQPVPGRIKLAFGVIVPMATFVVFDLLLFRSVGGKGEDLGFGGMLLYFRSFIIVPVLFVINGLLMWPSWKSKGTVVLVGFVPPVAVALWEYHFLYGQ